MREIRCRLTQPGARAWARLKASDQTVTVRTEQEDATMSALVARGLAERVGFRQYRRIPDVSWVPHWHRS